MEILVLLVFVSLVLVGGALLSFVYSVRSGDHEQAERLSILPLEPDGPPGPGGARPATSAASPSPAGDLARSPGQEKKA